ncbi:hypothetical protein GCM10023214_34300 [Amycolatopsis dongchuanensis]|uniref:Uncharacterized protein n=2 Tax=Amycolatopsis TaxID=1813 RepID=A0A1I3JL56_9PSEU|nr:hypothetical protein SAMN05421835_101180 [Amycolatopsis sacchari]
MLQTDGLDILIAWVVFGALLAALGFVLLRHGAGGEDDRK